jgi:hypothetical protein
LRKGKTNSKRKFVMKMSTKTRRKKVARIKDAFYEEIMEESIRRAKEGPFEPEPDIPTDEEAENSTNDEPFYGDDEPPF